MRITLKEPVKFGEAEISVLVFRDKLCAGDLRGVKLQKLDEMLTDDVLKIAGRLCAQPDPVMNALSIEDLAQVVEVLGGFFGAGSGPQTGKTPQP